MFRLAKSVWSGQAEKLKLTPPLLKQGQMGAMTDDNWIHVY